MNLPDLSLEFLQNLNAARSCFLKGADKQELVHELQEEYGRLRIKCHM